MNNIIQPDDTGSPLVAELFDRLALGADGQPFDDEDPETWGAADAAEPAVVFLGPARFTVVDADAMDLAVAAGAIEPGEVPTLCMRVVFEQAEGAPLPCVGQYLSVATDEPSVSILFRIWLTHSDLHDPAAPDLGPNAVRNEALDVLEPSQALLVQVVDNEEAEASA
jgi:hypothetical protein